MEILPSSIKGSLEVRFQKSWLYPVGVLPGEYIRGKKDKRIEDVIKRVMIMVNYGI